jgi:hypothetical protein
MKKASLKTIKKLLKMTVQKKEKLFTYLSFFQAKSKSKRIKRYRRVKKKKMIMKQNKNITKAKINALFA